MCFHYSLICLLFVWFYPYVSSSPRPVSYHISERDIASVSRRLYEHHFRLIPIGRYANSIYDHSCLYPLETNRFAPADCVLSPRCGTPVWDALESRWYGQEWGICYGSAGISKFRPYFDVYGFNPMEYLAYNDYWVYFLGDDILDILRSIFVGVYRGKYHILPSRCLDYMNSNITQLPQGVRFKVVDEDVVYDSISSSQFSKFCNQKPFDSLKDLVFSLPIYIDSCYGRQCHFTRIKWFDDYCENAVAHISEDRCICSDVLNPNYRIDKQCDEKEWDTHKIHFNVHYSNPIAIAFRSAFQFLWGELSHILEFIFVTLFEVIGSILLVMLSSLIEVCDELNLKIFESIFVGAVFYLFYQKFVLSCMFSLFVIIVGLLI